MEDKIIVEHLSLSYSDGTESLQDINLHIKENNITALIGPAGGGKSTFLRTLNRLNDLTDIKLISGKVLIDGENILDPRTDVIHLRQKVGIVFARPIPLPLSIYENVAYGLQMAGEKRKSALDEAVERALHQAQLWDEVHDRLSASAYAISGGQQQRLCLARVLALQPEIILLDEPTSALDPISTAKIENSLEILKSSYTILVAPHSTQQAGRIADDVAFFLQGELVEFLPATLMFTNPRDKRTQDYVQGRFG
ncbi:MAG TPA: phosphate ABC transporter ATP-binding protein [Anaerolineaceae bacterium]|nr:phosphate ABC transporter ATP-binding protein [Anaerolineaceae bacterium]HPN52733.1 phosphate ABC transporter ATP-binding protein [Anaerolineaceae bacterium]